MWQYIYTCSLRNVCLGCAVLSSSPNKLGHGRRGDIRCVPWELSSNLNRARNQQTGGYRPPRPPTSWVPSGTPQPGYGYMQPGAYPGSAPQYNMSQPPYIGYPPQAQQTPQVTGYDYYNQQQQQQQPPQQQLPPPPQAGGTSVSLDGNTYNYSQIPTAYNGQATYGDSTYSQAAVGYQQSYGQGGDYNLAGPQAGYTQPISNPQAAYISASSYGNAAQSTHEGANNPNYGVETSTPQAPTGQQPGATAQPGYAVTPTSQPGFASQPSAHANYSQSAPLQPSQAGLAQPAQVYGHSAQGYSQPPTAPSGYAQDPQQLPPGYVSGVPPAGYAQPSYGGYTQQQTQVYGDAYSGSAFLQPPYSTDGTPTTSAEPAAAPSGATKASHQS